MFVPKKESKNRIIRKKIIQKYYNIEKIHNTYNIQHTTYTHFSRRQRSSMSFFYPSLLITTFFIATSSQTTPCNFNRLGGVFTVPAAGCSMSETLTLSATKNYGQQLYDGPGMHKPRNHDNLPSNTNNWVCPIGVTRINIVAVGGGSGGKLNGDGGCGGGLSWANDVPVTPGTSYTVISGGGGKGKIGEGGGDSNFAGILTAQGGTYQGGGCFTTIVGGGGGCGGKGSEGSGNQGKEGSGGGAGGYTGGGGNGGFSAPPGGGKTTRCFSTFYRQPIPIPIPTNNVICNFVFNFYFFLFVSFQVVLEVGIAQVD